MTQISSDDDHLKHNDSVASSLSSTSSKRHLVTENNNSKRKIIKMAPKSTSKETESEFVPPDGGFQVRNFSKKHSKME